MMLIPMDNCPGDLNYDGVVDVSDLLILLGSWGPCDPNDTHPIFCRADINCDTVVDVSDLLALLGGWGVCHGFPDPPAEVPSLEDAVTGAGLTMNDWDDFVDVMTGTDEQAKENWNCWMQHYLFPCTICSSTCPGTNPFH